MAFDVNSSFNAFMKNSVNLDLQIVRKARDSRDNLLGNIAEFDEDDGFFKLWQGYNLHYGSFARKTKCQPLDDIDLMIGISAEENTYNSNDPWDNVRMYVSRASHAQMECRNDDDTLNSTKVINKFKQKLEHVREYSRSEIKRNGEAVVVNLVSKDWSFDIVPCFHTVKEADGRDYYLIPNGNGNWQKTDPRIDRDEAKRINSELDGRVFELIRLAKKWNKIKKVKTIPSYLLEAMLLKYCESINELHQYIDVRFINVLFYISQHIFSPVYDPKNIQGDINELSYEERTNLSEKAYTDYNKAVEANKAETKENDHKKAINLWGQIFGEDFPAYG